MQQIHLVVAVQVVFVSPVAELYTLEELIGDVGVAGGGHQGRKPVESGEDAVLDRARLDMARPTGDARYAEGAFGRHSLAPLERRIAAVRPGKHFGAIVSAEDEDRVLGLTNII